MRFNLLLERWAPGLKEEGAAWGSGCWQPVAVGCTFQGSRPHLPTLPKASPVH